MGLGWFGERRARDDSGPRGGQCKAAYGRHLRESSEGYVTGDTLLLSTKRGERTGWVVVDSDWFELREAQSMTSLFDVRVRTRPTVG